MYLNNFWQKKNSNPMNRQTVEKMTEWHDLCKVFQGAWNIVNLLVILVLTAIDIINVLQNSSGGEKNKCQDSLRHGSDRKFMTHMWLPGSFLPEDEFTAYFPCITDPAWHWKIAVHWAGETRLTKLWHLPAEDPKVWVYSKNSLISVLVFLCTLHKYMYKWGDEGHGRSTHRLSNSRHIV